VAKDVLQSPADEFFLVGCVRGSAIKRVPTFSPMTVNSSLNEREKAGLLFE